MRHTLGLASCQKEEEFDETLLIGKWKSGTLYEKYLSDHTGFTWDTKEDVTEDEGQKFTWKLEKVRSRKFTLWRWAEMFPKFTPLQN